MRHWEIQYFDPNDTYDALTKNIVWATKRFWTVKSARRYMRKHENFGVKFNHIARDRSQWTGIQRTELYFHTSDGPWVAVGQPRTALDLKTGDHYLYTSSI